MVRRLEGWITNGDQKALTCNRRESQNTRRRFCQLNTGQIQRLTLKIPTLNRAMHSRYLAQQHFQRYIDRHIVEIGIIALLSVGILSVSRWIWPVLSWQKRRRVFCDSRRLQVRAF
jgi:hypothetical protein